MVSLLFGRPSPDELDHKVLQLLPISKVCALRAVSSAVRHKITRLLEDCPWDLDHYRSESRLLRHEWLKHVLDANVRIRSLKMAGVSQVLNYAMHAGYISVVQEIVKFLEPGACNKSVFVRPKRSGPNRRMTPLHYACRLGNVDFFRALMSAPGVDYNTRSPRYRRTPLHEACRSGNVDIVKALLAVDCMDVNAVDTYKETPLHKAASSGRLGVFELLMTHSSIDARRRNERGYNVLHSAVSGGNVALVELILRANLADVNSRTTSGMTPLHIASCYAQVPEMVKVLLAHEQVDVGARDEEGSTALHCAAVHGVRDRGHYACLEAVATDERVDVNAQDMYGRTPLHKASLGALYSAPQIVKAVELLISHKDIDINVQSTERDGKRAPIHMLAEASPYGRYSHTDGGTISLDAFNLYMSNPALDVNSQKGDGNTILHEMADLGIEGAIRGLLSHEKVDVNVVNNDGDTSFHLLQRNSHPENRQTLTSLFIEHPSLDPDLTYGFGPRRKEKHTDWT